MSLYTSSTITRKENTIEDIELKYNTNWAIQKITFTKLFWHLTRASSNMMVDFVIFVDTLRQHTYNNQGIEKFVVVHIQPIVSL